MSQPTAFVNNDYCFACGSRNPLGLRLVFEEQTAPGGVRLLCTRVQPSPHWQGFQGVLHGGLQSTIIDDLMSNHLFRLEQAWAATVELKLRFRRPVPLAAELLFTSRVTAHSGRVWTLIGECLNPAASTSEVLTSAEGRFIEIPAGGLNA
jgi:acyl-coenzyme A thioesterase PaaI-like protein